MLSAQRIRPLPDLAYMEPEGPKVQHVTITGGYGGYTHRFPGTKTTVETRWTPKGPKINVAGKCQNELLRTL